MYQEKKQEEDLPALKITLMHRYNVSKTTKKRRGRLMTITSNNTDNAKIYRTKITRNQKWEEKQLYEYFLWKPNEISQAKIGRGWERETFREKLNLF